MGLGASIIKRLLCAASRIKCYPRRCFTSFLPDVPTMPYPAWHPGEIPWDLNIFPSPSWAHLVPPFPALERPLRLALPCIGLDGVSHGLAALNVPFQVEYAFNTLGCLRQALATIHGANAASFNVGPQEGTV